MCSSEYNEWDRENVVMTGSADGVVRMWSIDYVEVPVGGDQQEDQVSAYGTVSWYENHQVDQLLGNPQMDINVLESYGIILQLGSMVDYYTLAQAILDLSHNEGLLGCPRVLRPTPT